MIAHVSGEVSEKFNSSLIIDVGGVGYEVSVPLGDFDRSEINQSVKLYTHHHIREQSQELFGFSTLASKKLFQMLITVQGVGPKAALAILSIGESETIRNAIANGDSAFVAKANGVGKRIAERVVVDLADKVGLPIRSAVDMAGLSHTIEHGDEALEALMALGYNLNDATRALEGVEADLPTSERVKQALKG